MTEQTENATRLARPLIRLAKLVGVATSYVGMSHDYHEIEDDVLVAVLKALGIDASNDEAINQSITSIKSERETRVVAPTVLHIVGKESKVEVHGGMFDVPEASITLENGKQFTGKISHEAVRKSPMRLMAASSSRRISSCPPICRSYHTLEVTVGSEAETATVISAPEKIELLDDMKNGSLWGWMSQLYSIRSKGSWGVGDFEDLKTMLVEAKKKTGSDFILINPMHAAEPVPPLTPSPYLPISRRFINFSYIRPESMPEYLTLSHEDRAEVDALHEQVESLNGNARLIDRDAMWRVKKHALWVIYKAGRTKARQAEFDRYLAECGDEIESYATWCLCYDKWGAPSDDADNWVRKYNRDSEEVAQLREKFPDTLEFYRWLEWVATDQLHAAQQAARKAGMKIGIVADMAVGVHPAGSDVWWNPERFAKGATVGAPPDMFNQQGQDWSQPPLNPIALNRPVSGCTAIWCMTCSPMPVRCVSIISLVCSAYGGFRKASPPLMAHMCITIPMSCSAFSRLRLPVLVAWSLARIWVSCRPMCPSRCPNMAFSVVPWNGSNRWTVCSALRRIGVRTHWRPSIRMTCLLRPVTSNTATSSCVNSSACCPDRWRNSRSPQPPSTMPC